MTNDSASPERHAQAWRLVSRDAHSAQAWINAGDADPALLLVLDTRGDWWAVAAQCRHCAAPLRAALSKDLTRAGRDEIHCAQCGTAHGPQVSGCECVPLMIVDEEIYAASGIDMSAGPYG